MSTVPAPSGQDAPAPWATALLLTLSLAGLALAWLLTLWQPALLTMPPGHPTLPVLVHLLTLGAVLPLTYALLHRQWQALYAPRAGTWPLLGIALLQGAGVLLFAGGLWQGNLFVANLGGHYAVPLAVLWFLLWGAWLTWRRAPGRPRHLGAHVPGLGLALAVTLGAFLILDLATGGRWGVYTLHTIAVHLLAAGLLFLWPLLGWLRRTLLEGDGGLPADPAPLFRQLTVAALGVLLVAVGPQGRFGPHAPALGLGLLGALVLWEGWPRRTAAEGAPPLPPWRQLQSGVRVLLGALLLFMAIRLLRGAPVPASIHGLSALLLLAGMALPELLLAAHVLLRGGDGVRPGVWARRALWVQHGGTLGLALLLVGLPPVLGQIGAALHLAGVLLWARVLWRAAPSLGLRPFLPPRRGRDNSVNGSDGEFLHIRPTKRMTETARSLRKRLTPTERILWDALRREQRGYRVRRQQVVGPYVLDFYIAEVGIGIEIDGASHNGQDVRDAQREEGLIAEGVRILRFTVTAVESELTGVLTQIDNAVRMTVPRRPTSGRLASPALSFPRSGGKGRG